MFLGVILCTKSNDFCVNVLFNFFVISRGWRHRSSLVDTHREKLKTAERFELKMRSVIVFGIRTCLLCNRVLLLPFIFVRNTFFCFPELQAKTSFNLMVLLTVYLYVKKSNLLLFTRQFQNIYFFGLSNWRVLQSENIENFDDLPRFLWGFFREDARTRIEYLFRSVSLYCQKILQFPINDTTVD